MGTQPSPFFYTLFMVVAATGAERVKNLKYFILSPLRKTNCRPLSYRIRGHSFLNGQEYTHQFHDGGCLWRRKRGQWNQGWMLKNTLMFVNVKEPSHQFCLVGMEVFVILSPCTFVYFLKALGELTKKCIYILQTLFCISAYKSVTCTLTVGQWSVLQMTEISV